MVSVFFPNPVTFLLTHEIELNLIFRIINVPENRTIYSNFQLYLRKYFFEELNIDLKSEFYEFPK